MKKDTEVKLLMQERRKGTPQRLAAARAGMSERTARKYEKAGKLPSQLKRPHDWQTRENPFEEDWEWVVQQLKRDSALQGSTLFALLCEHHPGRYRPTQLRTLQRHIARWRAVYGPDQEVIFPQRHTPGERAQSDFTHMEDLGVTIAGEPFPHMVYHFVLTYSNVEAVRICFSETFEALAEGIEHAVWQIGGAPEQHRTDHLTAAVRQLRKEDKEDWTVRYQALMQHYGMLPTWNNPIIVSRRQSIKPCEHDGRVIFRAAQPTSAFCRISSTNATRPGMHASLLKRSGCARCQQHRSLRGHGSACERFPLFNDPS